MRGVAAAVAVIAGVLASTGCAGSGETPTTSVRPTTTGVGVVTTRARNREVRIARGSNRRFSIFPMVPAKRRCSIPEGGTHIKSLVLHGICRTSLRHRQTMEPSWTVTFTESWGCPPGADCPASQLTRHHTWQVIEGETIVKPGTKPRIYATRSSGAPAPQDYK
jgi:hypothetical protein